ncbi:MAG: UDP-N-acetyl-D-glucosamine dehydrogenase, partial [Firmicutes bacterium]|nr:UDP-N-acetyl-D-glucosamine dehydrogenase [Bacillota bacterium]
ARESPAIELIRLLKREGAQVCYHDDLIPAFRDGDLEMASAPLTAEALRRSDLVVIATDHSHVDYNWVVQEARHVLDTRNATRYVTNNRERITLL